MLLNKNETRNRRHFPELDATALVELLDAEKRPLRLGDMLVASGSWTVFPDLRWYHVPGEAKWAYFT